MRGTHTAKGDGPFSRKALIALILPLIAEQFLAVLVGMADTAMVSGVDATGSAVAAVSTVDTLNVLFINLFSAMSAGGAVVAAQYLVDGRPVGGCIHGQGQGAEEQKCILPGAHGVHGQGFKRQAQRGGIRGFPQKDIRAQDDTAGAEEIPETAFHDEGAGIQPGPHLPIKQHERRNAQQETADEAEPYRIKEHEDASDCHGQIHGITPGCCPQGHD